MPEQTVHHVGKTPQNSEMHRRNAVVLGMNIGSTGKQAVCRVKVIMCYGQKQRRRTRP